MYNVAVEWLDEEKSRAWFTLPGRQEWRAEHVTALIQVLAEIRARVKDVRYEVLPDTRFCAGWERAAEIARLATTFAGA
jgi:hypothetical protein